MNWSQFVSSFARVPTLALSLAAGCDVVSTRYPNKAAATKQGEVANGWLPQFIPDSAVDILTENDLDVNTSTGSFRFAASDGVSFASRLDVTAATNPPFPDWAKTLERMRKEGFELKYHSSDDITWAFFCKFNEGSCQYFMWLHGVGGTPR